MRVISAKIKALRRRASPEERAARARTIRRIRAEIRAGRDSDGFMIETFDDDHLVRRLIELAVLIAETGPEP